MIRSSVMLVLIAIIFMYLQRMEKCECVDISLVKRLQYTEMGVAAFISLRLIGNIIYGDKFSIRTANRFAQSMFLTVFIGLFGYLSYLVYLYDIDAKGCECTNQKSKYLLYTQGAYYAVMVGVILLLM
jgi:hypothetical protein